MGQNFQDVVGLKQILSQDLRPFARNLIVRLAEYAKGRKLVAADYSTVENILTESARDGYRLKSMVFRIAKSDLMTNK